MKKGISIITSFGCPFNCWYCIMKQHTLYNYDKPFDYNKLKEFLRINKDTSELSISGGGDPLNNFEKNMGFYYDFLFPTVKEIGMDKMEGIDIHTRIPLFNKEFWKKINRCVFSIDFKNGEIVNEKFLRWINDNKLSKLRLFHCLLPTTTDEDIERLINLSNDLNCQISVKQLHGFDDNGRFKDVTEKYPQIFKVYDKNYLIYYMPNNTITDTFLF
jgi:radical SAM superfamily enzyme YgiQ (UPF0313 family)